MAKKVYVVGNWKMYKTAREATDYIEALIPKIAKCKVNIFLAVPFTSIAPAAHYAKDTNIVIGAQNMNDAREGAFTGEIAGLMLKEAGAEFVILGHSERRHVFGETDAFVHGKVLRALQDDLMPILCVGETLKERETGKMEAVLRRQIHSALEGVPKEDSARVVLAYEPVWAIGTGKAATPELAEKAHTFCRECLEELFGKKRAATMSILYGGSVKPENAGQLVARKDVDGVLVGGASLDPEIFAKIALNCAKKKEKEE
ncbi:MAG TPA: triose-phosphate isomerase [Chlamydiales bacterium]|nr:triose-phosphate isomerase [Chlamydiales bacterium]